MIINENINICIIGLGYVGLSLAVEFGKKYRTTGYDISEKRVKELLKGYDRTLQVDENSLKSAEYLTFTYKTRPIAGCNYYIITVPTPVNKHNIPDMELLYSACKTVGKAISPGDTVIIESTVYPGFTEEEAVPLLEKYSGLKFNRDFFCGYSPERINPGDKKHVLAKIKKVVSGSTKKSINPPPPAPNNLPPSAPAFFPLSYIKSISSVDILSVKLLFSFHASSSNNPKSLKLLPFVPKILTASSTIFIIKFN